MHTTFMNAKINKKSFPHRLLLNLTDKMNLRSGDKFVALSNLNIYYTRENLMQKQNSCKSNTFKLSLWLLFSFRY